MTPPTGRFFSKNSSSVSISLGGESLPPVPLRTARATSRTGLDQLVANRGSIPTTIGGANAQLLIDAARRYDNQLGSMVADAEQLEASAPPPLVPPAQLLAGPQQAMAIGAPIPIVFARRRGGRGGVLHFPPATEAATDASPSGFSVAYHCVLGQGQMAPIAVWQVRQGPCRVGAFSQAYSRRAGAWEPGNRAQPQSTYELPDLPAQCGGGGDYRELSTIEFSNSYPPRYQAWNRAWNVFIESGMVIERGRIVDGVVGPSDNIVDLWLFWRQQNQRVPDELIDFSSLLTAAKFIDNYDLRCNAVFPAETDFIENILPWFLLQERTVGGKLTLVPMVRTGSDGLVVEVPTSPDWVLTDEDVVSGLSLESPDFKTIIDQPLIVLWRQQATEFDVPFNRTLYVSSTGVGLEGAETEPTLDVMDLSAWCDDELHAARIGAFYHAKKLQQRYFGPLTLRPGSHTGNLTRGQIIQVKITIRADSEPDYLWYEYFMVENVSYAPDGGETVAIAHWPVDGGGRGLLDLAFLDAQAPGEILPHPPVGDCDLPGRADDETIPPEQNTTTVTPFSQGGGGMSMPAGGSPGRGGGSGPKKREEEKPPGGADEDAKREPPRDAGGKRSDGDGKPGGPPIGDVPGYDEYCTDGKVLEYSYLISRKITADGPKAWQSVTSYGEPLVAGLDVVGGDGLEVWKLQYRNASGPVESPHATFPDFEIQGGYAVCADAPSGSPAPETPGYVVRKGDTLWDIAERILGDATRWPEIHALNRPAIPDPKYIFPGQLLKRPPA